MKPDGADKNVGQSNCWDCKYNDLAGTSFFGRYTWFEKHGKGRTRRSLDIELIYAASSLNRESNSEISHRIPNEFDNGEYYCMFPRTRTYSPVPNSSPGTTKTSFGDRVAEMVWEQYVET